MSSSAKRDPNLLETLKGEGSGILNVSLAGLRDCLRHGLPIPTKITAATDAYRDEQDILLRTVDERAVWILIPATHDDEVAVQARPQSAKLVLPPKCVRGVAGRHGAQFSR